MALPVLGASATGSLQSGVSKHAKTNPSSRGRGFFNHLYNNTKMSTFNSTYPVPFQAGPPVHGKVRRQEESKTLVTNQHNILSVSPQQQPTAGAKHTKPEGPVS